jgi:hypothetical protein
MIPLIDKPPESNGKTIMAIFLRQKNLANVNKKVNSCPD